MRITPPPCTVDTRVLTDPVGVGEGEEEGRCPRDIDRRRMTMTTVMTYPTPPREEKEEAAALMTKTTPQSRPCISPASSHYREEVEVGVASNNTVRMKAG